MKRTSFRALIFSIGVLAATHALRAQTWENRNALKLVLPSNGNSPSKTLTIQAPAISGSSFSWTLPDGNAAGILTNGGSGSLSWTQSLSGLTIDNTSIGATTASTGRFTSISTTTGGADFNSHGITNTGSLAGVTSLTLSGAISGGTSYSGSGDITSSQGKVITGSNSNAGHVKIGNGAVSNFFADVITASSGLSADRTYTIPTSPDANATFVVTTASPSSNTLLKWNSTAGNTTNASITDDGTTVSTSEGITSTGTGGLTSGTASTSTGKLVLFNSGSANSLTVQSGSIATASRTYTIPDAGASGDQFVITSATPTTNALPKWNGTAGLTTNSSITDNGTTVSTSEGITSTGTGGITSGTASTSTGKLVLFNSGSANSLTLQSASIATASRTYTIPDAGASGDQFVVTSAAPTNNTLPKWNSTSGLITNSSITDDGTTVSTSEGLSSTGTGGVSSGTASTSTGKIVLFNSGSANSLTLQSAAIATASRTYTLPDMPSSSGQVLSSTTSGGMSWVSALTLPMGQDLQFTTGSTRNINFSAASAGVGSTLAITGNAGAASSAGGPLTVTAGASGATTGNGGDLTLKGGPTTTGIGGAGTLQAGDGGTTGAGGTANVNGGTGGTTSGAAGAVSIAGGTPTNGAGGSVTISGSNAVGATGGSGGSVTLSAGTGSAAGNAAGTITETSGAGVAGSGATAGTNGGTLTYTAGTGGAAGSAAVGGTGGQATFQGGTGGAAITTLSGAASPGGAVSVKGGTGGAGNTGSTNGALGGAVTLQGGTGGAANGAGTTGNGGDVTISGGAAAAAAGTGGSIFLKTAASGSGTTLTTQMTINPSGGATVNNGNFNVTSGTYKIGGTDVLSSTTLGSGITGSSLTSVGTLGSLTVTGTTTINNSGTAATQIGNVAGFGSVTIGNSGAGSGNVTINSGASGTTTINAGTTLSMSTGSASNATVNLGTTGGLLISSSTANSDDIIIKPQSTTTTAAFAGTVTSEDLTAARTYTLPDATGNVFVGAWGQIPAAGTTATASKGITSYTHTASSGTYVFTLSNALPNTHACVNVTIADAQATGTMFCADAQVSSNTTITVHTWTLTVQNNPAFALTDHAFYLSIIPQ